MSRIAYVNGRYVPHQDAMVHVEDRGYQFADGVYEVCEVFDGRLVDETRHLDRLDRSLRELRIPAPMARSGLLTVMRRDRRPQSGAKRARLPAGDPRCRAARSSVSRAGAQACAGRHGKVDRQKCGRESGSQGCRRHHCARKSLVPGRHQIHRLAPERAGQATGEGGRREGSLVRGPGWHGH